MEKQTSYKPVQVIKNAPVDMHIELKPAETQIRISIYTQLLKKQDETLK